MKTSVISIDECLSVAQIYESYARRFFPEAIFRFSFRESTPKGQRNIKMFERIIRQAMDCGLSLELYIKVQFEQIMPWLKNVNPSLKYPPLSMLASPAAIKRVKAWKERLAQSYELDDERVKAEMSVPFKGYLNPLIASAEIFTARLEHVEKVYGEMNKTIAIAQLEQAARLGKLAKTYIATHPLLWEEGTPEYLAIIQQQVYAKLRPKEKDKLAEARVALEEKFAKVRMAQYV